MNTVKIIGAGLAGSEAAWQCARQSINVELFEMRPARSTPAHQTGDFAELVCSNSLKSDSENTAPWLLKEEMRRAGSLLLRIARECAVPAGHALAVDRVTFAAKVTEAISREAKNALDRPAIARMLGFDKFEPLTEIVPSASPAYVPGYNPRPFNPDKAKRLLAEAGYPSGFETKLLTIDFARDAAVAVQSYLGAVGIKVTVDVADMGRYFGALFGPQGWDDIALAASGINPDATDLFVHFGPRPMTYRFGFIAKSPEFLSLCEKALKTYDQAGVRAALQQAVRQGGEDAMVIPLFRSAQTNVMQDYVHTDYMKIHTVTWFTYQDWMEKRK